MTKSDEHGRGTSLSTLSVGDLIKFLKKLSETYRPASTGNPALAKVLGALANSLKPHAKLSALEFLNTLGERERTDVFQPVDSKTCTNIIDYPALNNVELEKLLSQDEITKKELVELGYQRFGIPRSGMQRMSKKELFETIRAALAHEESLRIISSAAKRGGTDRKS